MRFLTFEHWTSYFWDSRNKRFFGTKFENMVAELLDLEYPPNSPGEKWYRTNPSWDGKRDFYQQILQHGENQLRWAECKAYRKAISFNVLAPTLIMSTLRNVNEVVFFSYSRLNREAVSELQEFAKVHQMRARIYDDDRLERLILHYRDAPQFSFHKFFPEAASPPPSIQADNPVTCAVDAFIYRQNAKHSLSALKKQKMRINELFELRISLVNETLSPQHIQLSVDMERDGVHRCLDCMDRQLHPRLQLDLQKGEIAVLSLPFKITGYARQIRLPYIRLICGDVEIPIETGFFEGCWLLETPYFGDMNRLEQLGRTAMVPYETVIAVYGPGGAGKTRYLRELQGRCLLAGKKCLWSDAVHTEGNALTWLKYVLSRLYALPLINIEKYSEQSFPDVKERIVTDLLYDLDFTLTFKGIQQISAVFLKALERQDVLLIVDNVQDFDEDTIKILNTMLNLMPGTQGAHLVLSFNTDLLYKHESATAFFQRIRQLGREDGIHYHPYEITGLVPDDTVLFIHSCLLGAEAAQRNMAQSWRPVIRQIADTAGNNPLYLEQLLLYLCERDILRVEEDHLYVFDNHSLPTCLSQLPRTTQDLLKQRWTLLTRNASLPRGALERVVRFLCFFGELQPRIVREAGLDEDAIEYLIEAGFVRQEIGLTFCHPLIERFFWMKYGGLNKSEAKLCLRTLRDAGMEHTYLGQFYICLLQCAAPSSKHVESAIDALLSGRVPLRLIQSYGDMIFSVPQKRGGLPNRSLEKLLHFYIIYGDQQKKFRPMCEIVDIYETVYRQSVTVCTAFRQFGGWYFHFIKEYMNALLTERHNSDVVALGERLMSELDTFQFETEAQKLDAKAAMLNRMHVALNRLEDPVEGVPDSPHAHELLSEALMLSYSTGNPDGIIQNEIDLGNVYYLYGGPAETAVSHWKNAMQVWQEQGQEIPLWKGGVFFHQALGHALLHNWAEAEQAIKAVIRFRERTLHNPFHYAKALALRAVLLLIQEAPFPKVLDAVNAAEDICTASGAKSTLAVCSHVRALAYHLLSEDTDQAVIYYKKALAQYIGCCGHPTEEKRCIGTLTTVALALRQLGGASRYAVVDRLQSRNAAQTLSRILNADELAWKTICQEAPPKGLLYIEETGVNYPCV